MGLEERRQEKEIDGVLYQVMPLPFGIGRPLLFNHVLPLIGPLAAAVASKDYGTIFATICGKLTDAEVSRFADAFGKASHYREGDKWIPLVEDTREVHFAARYLAFMRWLTFNIEVNYAPFFAGLVKDAADLGRAPKTPQE